MSAKLHQKREFSKRAALKSSLFFELSNCGKYCLTYKIDVYVYWSTYRENKIFFKTK
jgi:hypothetical protein